jgi:hypothetical protein
MSHRSKINSSKVRITRNKQRNILKYRRDNEKRKQIEIEIPTFAWDSPITRDPRHKEVDVLSTPIYISIRKARVWFRNVLP